MRSILPVAVALLGFVTPVAALAGANKTWVSGTGTDTGTCPITAPCKSFQYALGQTSAGGEIDVKDAGGYGTVIINKAISIVAAPGILATISVPAGGTGIAVQAGSTDTVILRGLTIDGHGVGGNGIDGVTAAKLFLQDIVVQNLSGIGFRTESFYGIIRVFVSDLVAQNNATGANIVAADTVIRHSRFSGNHNGLIFDGNGDISYCIFELNSSAGFTNSGVVNISNSEFAFETETLNNLTYSYGDNTFRSGYSGTLGSATKN